MQAWNVIESVTEYETGWYTGGYDLVEQPDGTTKKYYWAALPPAVVIVPRHTDDIVFVEQYRPAIGKHCLELPAGIVEDNESFSDAASRELTEETGYTPRTIEPLAEFWVVTGVLRHKRGIVFADDLRDGEPTRDTNEFLSTKSIPIEAAIETARAAPANDATLEGLLIAQTDGYLTP